MDPLVQPLLHLNHPLTGVGTLRRWERNGPGTLHAGRGEHAEHEVTWVVQGGVVFRVGRREFEVRPGEVMVVPADAPHHTTFVGHAVVGSVRLRADYLRQLGQAVGRRPGAAGGACRRSGAARGSTGQPHGRRGGGRFAGVWPQCVGVV